MGDSVGAGLGLGGFGAVGKVRSGSLGICALGVRAGGRDVGAWSGERGGIGGVRQVRWTRRREFVFAVVGVGVLIRFGLPAASRSTQSSRSSVCFIRICTRGECRIS